MLSSQPGTSGLPVEDRLFYGYRLRTEVPLPTLPALSVAGEADIELRLGEVPMALPAPIWSSPLLEVGDDGSVLVRVGNELRFGIYAGREIILNAAHAVADEELATFLCSIVAGAIIHQRGAFALHASAVVIDGKAIALSGASGRGKSTLAATLAAEGFPVLTDDICRVCFASGKAMAIPGLPRMRLWPDAARALNLAPDDLEAGRPGHPKKVLVDPRWRPEPVPLGAIIRLMVDSRLDRPFIEPVIGAASVLPADDLVYRVRLGRQLGRRIGLFQDLAQLASLVPVFRLVRPETTLATMSELVDLVRSVG